MLDRVEQFINALHAEGATTMATQLSNLVTRRVCPPRSKHNHEKTGRLIHSVQPAATDLGEQYPVDSSLLPPHSSHGYQVVERSAYSISHPWNSPGNSRSLNHSISNVFELLNVSIKHGRKRKDRNQHRTSDGSFSLQIGWRGGLHFRS